MDCFDAKKKSLREKKPSSQFQNAYGEWLKTVEWRLHCEDGTQYGLSPLDYETADEYDEALQSAKNSSHTIDVLEQSESKENLTEHKPMPSKYIWRKYCSDGTAYGIDPEDHETADDYQDALNKALSEGKSPE